MATTRKQSKKSSIKGTDGKSQIDRTAENIVNLVERDVTGNGLDKEERGLNRKKNVLAKVKGGLVLVSYDIETAKNKKVSNPSWMLWRYGARMQYSVWIIRKDALDTLQMQELFTHWDNNEVIYDVIPQSGEGEKRLIAIAQRNLENEIRELHTSLITRIDAAAERLEAARKALDEMEANGEEVDPNDRDALENKHDNGLRVVFRETIFRFEGVLESARTFDDTDSLGALLNGLRNALLTSVEAFNVEMAAKEAKTFLVPKTVA